jgi:hypothetical protein
MATTSPTPELQRYPGGADHPAYRRTFQFWVIGFLLVICVSLLAFLATWAKSVIWR